MGQDHFLLLFRSLRGEKNDNAAINNENICPSIDSLGFGPNDGYSKDEFLFRNRNISRLNMVFVNEFDLFDDLNVYILFARKFIYDTVYYLYWIPYTCAQIMASFLVITIIYRFVNK